MGDAKQTGQCFFIVPSEKHKVLDAEEEYMLENNITVLSSSLLKCEESCGTVQVTWRFPFVGYS